MRVNASKLSAERKVLSTLELTIGLKKDGLLKKSSKRKVKYIWDEPGKFHWMVVFGGSLQDGVNQYSKKTGIEPWDVSGRVPLGHFTGVIGQRNGLIWFPGDRPKKSIIAHECVHAALFMFEANALKVLNTDTEEFFAYYVEFLFESIEKMM